MKHPRLGSIFLPQEWTLLAFQRAMDAWEASLKRPDLSEKDRVHGALLAYQSQLDALSITADLKEEQH